jgi:hypothetical protein
LIFVSTNLDFSLPKDLYPKRWLWLQEQSLKILIITLRGSAAIVSEFFGMFWYPLFFNLVFHFRCWVLGFSRNLG